MHAENITSILLKTKHATTVHNTVFQNIPSDLMEATYGNMLTVSYSATLLDEIMELLLDDCLLKDIQEFEWM